MKLLVDFLPIVIFFIVYKFSAELIAPLSGVLAPDTFELLSQAQPIIIATAVLIPATFLQILYTRWATGKIEKMHLVTLALVVVLGGATVLFGDKSFIQWKPTIVNWLFAGVFLGSQFIGSKNLIQRMMDTKFTMPAEIWKRLNYGWVAFFVFAGAINLYVAFTMSEESWVNFKLFGMLGLTLVFIIAQGIYLSRHIQEPTSSEHGTQQG
ncbi:septation protein A [Aestuariirhabdus litorea]|uniref:Inner membrane-spanning protein YciB n=1 Tax=Aestuariirhabdus litorea TaxID=2528527 RepID=A0A3P3VND5_9GAMM|nr:septation protein A [Aestuariirhabdus litorea]RRJ84215.1 septation protein A [Aestuariirhabdus litorea]RWW97437.1 septation protein A [Endozoicomonadaceae bacterium GTF-13]